MVTHDYQLLTCGCGGFLLLVFSFISNISFGFSSLIPKEGFEGRESGVVIFEGKTGPTGSSSNFTIVSKTITNEYTWILTCISKQDYDFV